MLAELLAALRAVWGERADEFVAEVHVDELTDLDDSHDGAGVSLAECDSQAVVADDAVAPHLAQERVRRVVRSSLHLVELKLPVERC
jgi:hypothetical protein